MTKSNAHEFPLGSVLTVATGRLLCPIGDVYEILNFLLDADIYTHQIPKALNICAPLLKVDFPFLQSPVFHEAVKTLLDVVDASKEDKRETIIQTWITEQQTIYGHTLPLFPVSSVLQELFINPLQDLKEMVGDKKIIVVQREEGNHE